MKTLLVLRHSKSSWSDPDAADFDRQLNKRGRRDAPRVGQFLREQQLLPEVMLVSAAARTQQTAELLMEASDYAGGIFVQADLYLARPAQYVAALQALPVETASALVLGHNPGLEQLVSILAGEHHSMRTSALAVFLLPLATWGELELRPYRPPQTLWRPSK